MSDFTWFDVPNDPSEPLPGGRSEPLNFRAHGELDRVLIDYGDGDEICAYRAGAFRGRYAFGSTIDAAQNVKLVRSGGWPRAPKVICKLADRLRGVEVASDYAAKSFDWVLVDASAGPAKTITLPSAGVHDGEVLVVERAGPAGVAVILSGPLDGGSSLALTDLGESVAMRWSGFAGEWQALAHERPAPPPVTPPSLQPVHVSASYAAKAFDQVFVDAHAGAAKVITLPSSAADGDVISVRRDGTVATSIAGPLDVGSSLAFSTDPETWVGRWESDAATWQTIAHETVAPPPPLVPTLQPTLYAPLGQWALKGAPTATTAALYNDRSGNARHLTAGNAAPIPGRYGDSNGTAITDANALRRDGDTAIAYITGAFTITFLLWFKPIAGNQTLMAANSGVTTAPYALGIENNTGRLFHYQEVGTPSSPNGTAYFSTLVPPAGVWTFVSYRRASDGSVTFGLNTTYNTVAVPIPPAAQGGPTFHIASDYDGGYCRGGMQDFCLWGRYLTDAELVPLYKAAMGVA